MPRHTSHHFNRLFFAHCLSLLRATICPQGPYLHAQVHPLAAVDQDLSSSDGSCSSSDSSQRLAWTWFNNQVQDELTGLLLDQDLEVHAHSVPLGALK